MPKNKQASLQRHIALGVLTEPGSVILAVGELVAMGISPSALCLAGLTTAIRDLAEYSSGTDLGAIRVLLEGLVETSMTGGDVPILASPTCVCEVTSVPAPDIESKVRELLDGAIVLAVFARNAAELVEAGRVLLRHCTHHVHTFEHPLTQLERTPT